MDFLDLTKSLTPNILLFKLLGHWPFGLPEWLPPKYYRIFTHFITINATIYNLAQFVYLVKNMSNFEEVAATIYNFFSTVSALIKVKIFYNNRKMFKEIVDTLLIPEFQPTKEIHRTILKKSVVLSNFVFYFFFIMADVTLFMWIFFPVLDNEKRLPSNAWFPYDYLSKYYTATYIWQSFFICFHAMTNVSLDTFFSIMMIQLGAQCDVLNEQILTFADVDDFEDVAKLRENFMVFIHHHQLILEWSTKMGDVFLFMASIQFMTSVSVLCETMFMLSFTNVFSATYVMLLFYEIAIFTQVYLYCWYGNEVISKSENLLYSAFSSQWIHCPQSIKKDLLYFIHRTRKPIVLYVGTIFPISVVTFSSILRSSWAYFMALRNINS